MEYYLLKCNFHTHFFETYGNNAKIMVDAYHDAGYDCIALTEHDYFLNDLEIEKEAKVSRGGIKSPGGFYSAP